VFGIARHELSAYFRRCVIGLRALAKIGLSVAPLIDADYERVEELGDLRALRLTVSDALAHLTVEHREALRLGVVEEQPYAEIARTVGVSETTVRARVSPGLRALSKATASLEGSPEHA
jgi:RNA polymerase sigma-70 factor (ECF subfamily)